MATIIIKNSTGSGAVPSSLVQGELAINTKDGKLFYGSGSGNIVKEFTGSGGGSAISASYALTASYASNGGVTQLLAGANISLSPTTGVGQVTISSTAGGGGFNTATGSYGSFYDTTTQTNVAGTARSMSLNTTDISNGVSVSGSTNPFNTYIKVENAGVYDIQFSAQIDKSDAGKDEIWIWLRKNGTDLTDTATSIQLTGNADHQVAAWNFFANAAANDYFQLMWYSLDANVRLHAEPAFGIVPGIPSLIVTANRVDQFLSNTGSFSGSFTGSLFGTASWATNALTASRAISASYAPIFPYVGTATITGSLIVSSSTTQLSGPSHTVRASTGDISLFATASSINTQTQRFRIYDPSSTVGVSDHLYIYANTSDGGMYWSGNDEVIANYNQAIGRYNYGNNNLYVSSSDNRTYSPSGFVGPLIGTASWATNVLTASAATTVEVNDVPSNNATNYLSFFLANSGYRPTRVASTKFVVNPATGSMGINKSTITTGYNLDVNGSVLISGSALITGSLNVTGSTTLNNGQTTIRGAGATSATTTLLVQNSTPTTLFRIQDHGSSSFNGNLTVTGSFNQGSASLASGLFSHVQGFNTTASGIYSHAEGQNTRATGQYSHAEGNGIATGNYSHAEGSGGATGNYSHAEGYSTGATGQYSHAEGFATSTTGQASHAEGQQTTANGESSHAEGQFTITNGFFSHAEGVQTRANGIGSHAEGGWSYYDDGDFIFPGGTAAGNASHAEGLDTLASGEGAHAEGYYTTASGNSAHAEGYYTIANGAYQHVQGQFNQPSPAQSAFIIGNGTSEAARSNLVFASGSQFQITGSLNVSGSARITNNLTVTGSTILNNGQTTIKGAGATSATTTLIVQNSTPTNIITVLDNGTVGIRRTPTASLDIAGTTRLSGSFDTAISGAILTVVGSGSTQPIFTVQGSQGELFSINDSLSGSLFSVNDISGLPILEVFSDNTTLIGDYQDPMLITTKKVTMTNSGSFVVYSLPTASYDTAFFDYSIKSGSNARAGQIMAIQSGSSVNFTETTTTSFGSTTAVSFTVLVSGSNMVLTGSASTGSWTIKSIIRGI